MVEEGEKEQKYIPINLSQCPWSTTEINMEIDMKQCDVDSNVEFGTPNVTSV